MSEKHKTLESHNRAPAVEQGESLEAARRHHEKLASEITQDTKEKSEKARVEAHRHATESEKIKEMHDDGQAHHERSHHYLTKSIKKDVYRQTLGSTQTHLTKTQVKFSKFVHNDTVEKLSDVGSKTIARPNAILGGGVIMVIGGIFVLIAAKRYGFEVPLSAYLAFYLVGFTIFIVFDLLGSYFKRLANK